MRLVCCRIICRTARLGVGLWTSTAIPLLALWGGWPILGIALGIMVIWTVVLVVMNRRGG